MDVRLYSLLSGGRCRTFKDQPVKVADRMFREHSKLLQDPFVTYYRITLSDPDRGGYVVRDSDLETHGIRGGAA